jgi:hypothetical protein
MDIFTVGTLLLVALALAVVIIRNLNRSGFFLNMGRCQPLNDINAENLHARLDDVIQQSEPYIQALRSNDPNEIAKAPLPSNFTPEMMFQTLLAIQNQPSAIDRFFDTFMARFDVRQYRKLMTDWHQYLESSGSTYDSYLRRVTERLDIPLEGRKTGATLEADIAEQELRAEDARHKQTELSRPLPELARERTPEEELEEEDIRWEQRRAWLVANNFPEEYDRHQEEKNIHEDIVRRILNKMRRRS